MNEVLEDWIYLYYLNHRSCFSKYPCVLEDWIYLYYLNVFWYTRAGMYVLEDWIYLYYLNLRAKHWTSHRVLEDWIYLYYLNHIEYRFMVLQFLRTEFICIIWTVNVFLINGLGSWGLNLFVLFERSQILHGVLNVLEDWIYLYYLNSDFTWVYDILFLRTEFICIIWTLNGIRH